MLARLGELTDTAAADDTEDDRAVDAARVDAITLLERIQAAAAATQAALSVRFARSQVTTQQQQLLRDPRAVGRGIADQLALACRVSPTEGSRRLGIARALHTDLPATAALLRRGQVSFYVAEPGGVRDPPPRPRPPPHRRRKHRRGRAGRVRAAAGRRADPQARLRRRPGRVRRPRPDRAGGPAGQRPTGPGHDERAVRVPARRTRSGLLGRATRAHRHRQEHRRHPLPGPDHGRHPGRTAHRTGARRRRAGRDRHRHPGRRPHRPHQHWLPPRRSRRARPGGRACAGGRGARLRPAPHPDRPGDPRRFPGAALVAAAVHRPARRRRRRRPHPPLLRRHPRHPDRLPRRRPLPRTVLRRPRPPHRPHRRAPRGRADHASPTAAPPACAPTRSARCPAGRSASPTTDTATTRTRSSP